ncbi:MAG TPA: potassium transporter, partial [Campylobacterales bacterium]|nr:potassium transporter [Campylobacterales bacterium]
GVLEHFAVRDSLAVIVAISNQHQIRLICENINSFNADINTIVKVRNSSEGDVISDLNINNIINSRDMVSDILVERALECKLP